MQNVPERVFCLDCIYFNRNKHGRTDLGYCQIDAPIIIPATGNKSGQFPIMGLDGWCGQGIKKQDPSQEESHTADASQYAGKVD